MIEIAFKATVRVSILAISDPEMIRGLEVAALTAPKMVDNLILVTSQDDSTHMETSLHYVGRGWDLRIYGKRLGAIAAINSRKSSLAQEWVRRMKQLLPRWDIILEKDHIHMELQR